MSHAVSPSNFGPAGAYSAPSSTEAGVPDRDSLTAFFDDLGSAPAWEADGMPSSTLRVLIVGCGAFWLSMTLGAAYLLG